MNFSFSTIPVIAHSPATPAPASNTKDSRFADAAGLVVQGIERGAEKSAAELKNLAREAAPLADNLSKELTADAHAFEEVAGRLKFLDRAFTVLDAGNEAVTTFEKSDARTLPGRVTDAVSAAGSKVLATAALPLAAVDFATDGELTKLYHAGLKATGALGCLATGDAEPGARFNDAAARGDEGAVAKGIHDGVNRLKQAIPNTLEGIQDIF